MKPITTERLTLRPFRADDANDLADRHAYQSLPEVARYLYRPPLTREACAKSIAAHAAGTRWQSDDDALLLAVTRTSEPGVLGEVVLTLRNAHARQAEIGWIFHPAWAGKGYATEAARALTNEAFTTLGVHRVYARLDALNKGSANICERLGMRREAHLIDNDLDGDRWGSEYIYALLAREWRS
ncbi:GNAT family N-acetyltransferase [Streptomyces boninensis]|uniref:GNAT family N-acetyltransferase n=1 Tax=Streptomyces boninensis TaxID=2039455 RepID=UPI003B21F288